MILLDTSGLLAWIDSAQSRHHEVVRAMNGLEGPFVLSPFVLAELDYLLAKRVGQWAQEALLEEVGRGSYRLESFTAADVHRALEVARQFSALEIGLADASIVALAERYDCATVLTLDERHFRVLGMHGKPFRLIPSDAQPG